MPPPDSDMGPSSYAFRGISDLLMSIDLYEVRPHKVYRGVNLISDALTFGQLWYGEPSAVRNAFDYTKFRSRSHDAAIRVYDEAGNAVWLLWLLVPQPQSSTKPNRRRNFMA